MITLLSNRIRSVAMLLSIAALIAGAAWAARAGDLDIIKGDAPPDHAVLKHARGGAYFVPKDLKERHDQLLARVGRIKGDLAGGKIKGDAALRELKEVEPLLEALRKEIEEKKVLVSPVKVQKQSEELSFDLGPEQMLIITADHLRVVGWDGPKVKCVLDKELLATSDKLETEEFKGFHLTHQLATASDLVGRTVAEIAEDEKKFIAEHADKPLTEAQLASRRQFVAEIQRDFDPYSAFQGKKVDIVDIEGLSGQQGNRQITVEVRSKGGGGMMGSDWRRQAMLTVYVPRAKGVLLRGCLAGLEVDGLAAPLVVSDVGSLDRNYDGAWSIKKLAGPLALYNVPLDRLEQVQGDVKIVATVEHANTGTHYEGGQRTTIIPPPRELIVDGIAGNFTAWFARVNLKLAGVSGVVDVKNETGDTTFTPTTPLAEQAHRLVSHSGKIVVKLKESILGKLPLLALTNEGAVKTNAPQTVLEDTNFTTGTAIDGSLRDWRGVKTVRMREPGAILLDIERPAAVLRDAKREPGLDIISHSGTVDVTIEK